ncbi:MAG: hypothetical protein P1V19_14115 [Gimesia sp.]|nr:hypothetical protein [Gimesia sp.]
MRKPLFICTLILMQAMVLLTAQTSHAQNRVQAAQRIPADSLLYFSIPDVETLGEKWSQCSMGQMTHDAAFADLKKDLIKQIEKFSEKFEEETDLSLSNVLSIPSGEVCFAFVKSESNKFGGLAFMEYGESGEILEKILAKVEESLDKKGAKRSILSVDGTKVIVYSFGDESEEGPVEIPLEKKFAYFLKDKTFVASNDDKILESVLSNLVGQDKGTL